MRKKKVYRAEKEKERMVGWMDARMNRQINGSTETNTGLSFLILDNAENFSFKNVSKSFSFEFAKLYHDSDININN